MRKLIIPLILLIALMTACGKPISSNDSSNSFDNVKDQMPKMSVVADGVIYQSATGAYCWSIKNATSCTDTSGDPFDYVDTAPPIVVKPGEAIELRFTEDPDSFTIDLEVNDKSPNSIKGNPFVAPLVEGMYGYSVYTEWGSDDIAFHFVLDVQK